MTSTKAWCSEGVADAMTKVERRSHID